MRSLGNIRARVERLASDWLPPTETMFVSWIQPLTRCPSCRYDLDAHAQAAALAEAVTGRDPRDLPPPLVFSWTGLLKTCPRCGVTLPTAG